MLLVQACRVVKKSFGHCFSYSRTTKFSKTTVPGFPVPQVTSYGGVLESKLVTSCMKDKNPLPCHVKRLLKKHKKAWNVLDHLPISCPCCTLGVLSINTKEPKSIATSDIQLWGTLRTVNLPRYIDFHSQKFKTDVVMIKYSIYSLTFCLNYKGIC